MSTPMYDLPEHFRIGLTKEGNGPADPPDPAFDHFGCWCGQPLCQKWIEVGSIWRHKTRGERIQILHTKFRGEAFYKILPPDNTVRDYGTIFESVLSRQYEKEADS